MEEHYDTSVCENSENTTTPCGFKNLREWKEQILQNRYDYIKSLKRFDTSKEE